jgi:hypothetical protein
MHNIDEDLVNGWEERDVDLTVALLISGNLRLRCQTTIPRRISIDVFFWLSRHDDGHMLPEKHMYLFSYPGQSCGVVVQECTVRLDSAAC